jgi:hypothetical protein
MTNLYRKAFAKDSFGYLGLWKTIKILIYMLHIKIIKIVALNKSLIIGAKFKGGFELKQDSNTYIADCTFE